MLSNGICHRSFSTSWLVSIESLLSTGTRLVHPHFNARNKADARSYLKPSQCHYLADSDRGPPSAPEPAYWRDSSVWEVTAHAPILDADKSHKIFRAFYVPIFSERNTKFGTLYLLKNRFI